MSGEHTIEPCERASERRRLHAECADRDAASACRGCLNLHVLHTLEPQGDVLGWQWRALEESGAQTDDEEADTPCRVSDSNRARPAIGASACVPPGSRRPQQAS
jgi:hypothetical protein